MGGNTKTLFNRLQFVVYFCLFVGFICTYVLNVSHIIL